MTAPIRLLFSVILLLCGAMAQAATIDTSAYGARVTVLDAGGTVFYDAASPFFETRGDGGGLALDTFDLNDPGQAALDADMIGRILTGADQIAVATEMVQFLFVDGATGYLVTVDATGAGVDFSDADALIDTVAQVRLEQLTTAQVPVPAALPLLLAGIGGLAGLRCRRRV